MRNEMAGVDEGEILALLGVKLGLRPSDI